MSTWEERRQAERGCKLELQKQNIAGTAEFRKWAVRNHPDKGGKLRVFQKVSGCVDLMYKTPEADTPGPSTSYSQSTTRPPGKRTKPRTAKPTQSEYFWSADEDYDSDDDFIFVNGARFPRGPQHRARDGWRRGSDGSYVFRATSPMGDNVTFEDWEEFEEFIREHARKREWDARRAEEMQKERKREQKRKEGAKEREKERKARPRGGSDGRAEKEAKAKRATSPDEWRGPPNPYKAPEAPQPSRSRGPRREPKERTPREKGRAAAQEFLQRMKRAFHFEGERGHRMEGELSWRHRLSRPQLVFMVAQLTCIQSVFLSTAFKRF